MPKFDRECSFQLMPWPIRLLKPPSWNAPGLRWMLECYGGGFVLVYDSAMRNLHSVPAIVHHALSTNKMKTTILRDSHVHTDRMENVLMRVKNDVAKLV